MTASRQSDALIALLILIAGITLGAVYRKAYDDAGGVQDLPQREFGAAIAMACGHGFVNPGYLLTPALDEFLTNRRDRMSCADLPTVIPPMQLNITQALYRYLMVAAALVWRVTGVSWKGLTPLYAIAYGLTLTAAYGLFRLGIGRVMSVAATAALALSAVHLQHLPFLRDYAKAPFMLGLIFIMGRLATGEWSDRRALSYAAVFGVVLGVGFGFRNDLLIAIVPWIIVLLFATPGPLRANLKTKAACVAVSAAVFTVVAWPILSAYSQGSNTGHVALLGLVTSFDGPLGVAGSIYDPGYMYLDGFASALISSFAFRQHGLSVVYLTRDYDHAAVAYVLAIARHWPADMLARAYGSLLTVLELPFAVGAHVSGIPVGARGSFILRFYTDHGRLLQLLNGLGAPMAALTLAAISVRNLRAAIVLLVLLVYFAGYPALQFHVRHYFHLEFIAWWTLAFLVEHIGVYVWRHRQASWMSMTQDVLRAGAFAVAGFLVLAGTLAALRAYQSSHGRSLLREEYFGADREPVETTVRRVAPGRVLVETHGLWRARKDEPFGTEYIVAQFSSEHCDAIQVPTTFRYTATTISADFSHDVSVRVPRGGGSTVVMSPVFDHPGWSRFAGIELPARESGCLTGVFRVKPEKIPPVLLDINAPPRWERAKLYQTLAAWESPSDGEEALPRLYAAYPGHALRVGVQPNAFALTGPSVEYRNAIVRDGPGATLRVSGHPDAPHSFLVVLKDQTLVAGSTVIARGEIRRGGIALGLFRGGEFVTGIDVTDLGAFEAALQVPATGRYSVSLSNRVGGGWLEDRVGDRLVRALAWIPRLWRRTDITIASFGWLPGDAAMAGSAP